MHCRGPLSGGRGFGLPASARAIGLTQLAVSELVTKTGKARGRVLLELRITADLAEVVVWDSGLFLPVAWAADPGG